MINKDLLLGLTIASNITLLIASNVLARELKKQKYRYDKLWDMSSYLVGIIERNDVDLDEFDLIAFRELGFREES